MSSSIGAVRSYVVRYPAVSYTAATTLLAYFALSPTPPLPVVIPLLAIIRLSAWTFAPRPRGYLNGALEAAAIAVAAAAAHLAPSIDALSTPNVALAVLSVITLITSAIAVSIVFVGCLRVGTPWTRLTVFPALWASAWGFVSQVSPVGQLVTWSPVVGLGPYAWLRSYFGQWGVDWVAAAWAVVISEMLGDWLVGQPDDDGDALVDTAPLLGEHADLPNYHAVARSAAEAQSKPATRFFGVGALTASLLFLTVPYLIAHPHSPSNEPGAVTPVGVACVLPTPAESGGGTGNPTLDDFILGTQRVQSTANVILWPESAVRFDNPQERMAAFEKIQNETANLKYIGVSFEEYEPSDRAGQPGKRRNGFALLGHTGPPVIEYYKRNLVPSV